MYVHNDCDNDNNNNNDDDGDDEVRNHNSQNGISGTTYTYHMELRKCVSLVFAIRLTVISINEDDARRMVNH